MDTPSQMRAPPAIEGNYSETWCLPLVQLHTCSLAVSPASAFVDPWSGLALPEDVAVGATEDEVLNKALDV